MQLTRDREKHCAIAISGKIQPGCATWGLFMGSLLAATPEEEEFFAQRIAKGTRNVGSMFMGFSTCEEADANNMVLQVALGLIWKSS